MKVALVTGSGGLIGSEAAAFFNDKFDLVVGIDNNMREKLFGASASVSWKIAELTHNLSRYRHFDLDIRHLDQLERVFSKYASDIKFVVHAAAQPSHDWSAQEPFTDFSVNANGTLNLLELSRRHCSSAVFVYLSTNKVYGDNPNRLPLIEHEKRWEISSDHRFYEHGIDESLSVDHTMHTIFGASKLAGDALCQEYGRYFGMNIGVFRGGCLTGPNHSGAKLHGFLSYLVRSALLQETYTIIGHKGKQVRDNVHSWDLINMLWNFYQSPRQGEVYNVGGSRFSNCSVLEAIDICERLSGKRMNVAYQEQNRKADHIWWISDIRKFRSHYPEWDYRYSLEDIMTQIIDGLTWRVERTIPQLAH